MFFRGNKDKHLFDLNYKLKKQRSASNGFRVRFKFQRKLPLQIMFPKLLYKYNYLSGRNASGRVVVRTKKTQLCRQRRFKANYSFRLRNIGFIASVVMLPFSHKLFSLSFLSSGSATYLPTTSNHKLFILTRLYRFNIKLDIFKDKYSLFFKKAFILQGFYLLVHLPRHKPISLIEILPGKGIQYVRSPGTSAKMTRLSKKLTTGLLTLPSGVRKIFSIFSISSLGSNVLSDNKL
jgi:ribosomal protein L2